MIGSVKTRAFKDDPDWCIHLAQGFLSALRAARQRSIGKFLIFFKLDTAAFTPVGIDRHTEPQTYIQRKELKIFPRIYYTIFFQPWIFEIY